MRVTMLATAIALAAGIGSVSAADPLTTLNGVKAVPMSSGELSAVKGTNLEYFRILPPGEGNYPQDTKGRLDPPSDADPLDNGSRIETNHYQAENGQGNFVTIEVMVDGALKSFTISPSWLGLRNAGCNGVIVFPYPGNSDISEFCP